MQDFRNFLGGNFRRISLICKICNQKTGERRHFWLEHKIKEKDYYLKYEPKFDLLTKEIIDFKNPEQYESTDFTDKRHLKKYLENHDKEEGLNYCKNWLLRRKNNKSLIYSPSNFEVRS